MYTLEMVIDSSISGFSIFRVLSGASGNGSAPSLDRLIAATRAEWRCSMKTREKRLSCSLFSEQDSAGAYVGPGSPLGCRSRYSLSRRELVAKREQVGLRSNVPIGREQGSETWREEKGSKLLEWLNLPLSVDSGRRAEEKIMSSSASAIAC
jgi:hypothetical protein